MSKQYSVQPNGLSTMLVEADEMVNNPNGSVELWKDEELIQVVPLANAKYVSVSDAYEIQRKH